MYHTRCWIYTSDGVCGTVQQWRSVRWKTYFYSSCILTAGLITVFDNITFTLDSDLNGDSPQFTLTCNSTRGPATTVTWTRDSITVTEGTETVLNDPVTAQYNHTLSGTMTGIYTCSVYNNQSSGASANITLQGTYNTAALSLTFHFPYSCRSSL